jgi:tRNA(Ile)-lysidine synthase
MIENTLQTLHSLGVTRESRVMVAVSGGMDSVSLAFAMREIECAGEVGYLALAHVNHGLRGEESDGDAAIVCSLGEAWKLPVFVKRSATRERMEREQIGLEETARNERYEFFRELIFTEHIDFLLTAHTLNDQAETILMNLARGAGVKGLSGIPQTRMLGDATLLRPWLSVERSEIEEFAKANQLRYHEDSSNASDDFQRNRVRHHLIPVLQDVFADRDILRSLERMSGNMRSVAKMIDELASAALKKMQRTSADSLLQVSEVLLDANLFRETTAALQAPILELAIAQISRDHHRLDQSTMENIRALIHHGPFRLDVSGKLSLGRRGDELILEVRGGSSSTIEATLEIGQSIETEVGTITSERVTATELEKHPDVAYFDLDVLGKEPLLVRSWTPGDLLRPFGFHGTKHVSDLLLEAGVRTERSKSQCVVVVLVATGEIVWVPGVRRSQLAPVTATTRNILVLRRTTVNNKSELRSS